MAQSIICARSFEFAARILNLFDCLWRRGPIARHIGQELAKCGTSIGANAEEAQNGQTKPDFIAKLAVSRKRVEKRSAWLRLALLRVEVVTSDDVKWEMEEAAQLRAMIVSAIKTAQSSQSRG